MRGQGGGRAVLEGGGIRSNKIDRWGRERDLLEGLSQLDVRKLIGCEGMEVQVPEDSGRHSNMKLGERATRRSNCRVSGGESVLMLELGLRCLVSTLPSYTLMTATAMTTKCQLDG